MTHQETIRERTIEVVVEVAESAPLTVQDLESLVNQPMEPPAWEIEYRRLHRYLEEALIKMSYDRSTMLRVK